MSRRFTFIFIGVTLLLQPFVVFAQVTNPTNTAATNATIGRFNPSIGISGSGNNFQGLNFSGVGGALLSCTNVGSSISNSLQGLFNKSGGGSAQGLSNIGLRHIDIPSYQSLATPGQQIPVKASATDKELEKQTKTQNCLNGVAYAIAHNMLQQMTTRTLNFVNRGFGGNPLYVRDMDSFLKSIRDEKLSTFLQTVPNTDPVFGNAIRSAITKQVTGYTDGRINQAMNTPEAQQYEAFQNDFTQGGWSTFLNPKNNALSAYFNAVDTVTTETNTAQQNVKDELGQGNGFLSVKKCVEYETTPPVATGSCSFIYTGNYASCCTSVGGAATNQAQCRAYTGGYQSTTVASTTGTGGAPKCLKTENVTPGKIVADQTAAVTTSSYRQLEQADQINEVLGSFFDQLLSRLFADGLGSVGGSNTTRCTNGAGVGCNVVIGTNGQILSSATTGQSALGYQSTTGGFNGDFDISRPQQLRAIIQTQTDYLVKVQDSQIALSRIVPVLGALDYCIPGPNPTWTDNLRENYETHVGSLVQPSPDSPGFFQNLVNSIPIIGGLFGGTPKPPPILASAGYSLFDKVTNNSINTKDRPVYEGYTLRQSHLTSSTGDPLFDANVDDDNVIDIIRQYIDRGYEALVNDYTNKFKPTDIVTAFKHVAPSDSASQTLAENQITDSLKETSKLASYNLATVEYMTQYDDSISQTEYALRELTDINKEVLQIVGGAKARYIAAQAAAGTPVDMACINQAYTINNNPITPTSARVESPAPDFFTSRSIDASNYFYSHLFYQP